MHAIIGKEMQWVAVVCTLLFVAACHADQYYIGTGRYDITGPAAEVNMVSFLTVGLS